LCRAVIALVGFLHIYLAVERKGEGGAEHLRKRGYAGGPPSFAQLKGKLCAQRRGLG